MTPKPPAQHASGARPPAIPASDVPKHVALVMDGNGRWAKERGLARTEGHARGEFVLFDLVQGCIEIGVKWLSVYAFSTENWRRSPEEVRYLMGFNRDVVSRRRDEMHEMGVRVRWAGRRPRLWKSVIAELETAEELTKDNDVLNLTMCVNYGGRAEIADGSMRRPLPNTSMNQTCLMWTCFCEPLVSNGSATSSCGSPRTPN
jgi:undecaprenyl diphosphate synthase